MSLLNNQEVMELETDIRCLQYLMKYLKENKIDVNIYYELVFYKLKLEKWYAKGINETFVKDEVISLLNVLDMFFSSFTEDKLKKLLSNNKRYLNLESFDKLKYKNNQNFKGYVEVIRENFNVIVCILVIITLATISGLSFTVDTYSFIIIFIISSILLLILSIIILLILNYLRYIPYFNRIDYYYVRGYKANMYIHDRITRNLLISKYEIDLNCNYGLDINIYDKFIDLVNIEFLFIQFKHHQLKTIIYTTYNKKEEEVCMNLL